MALKNLQVSMGLILQLQKLKPAEYIPKVGIACCVCRTCYTLSIRMLSAFDIGQKVRKVDMLTVVFHFKHIANSKMILFEKTQVYRQGERNPADSIR